MMVVMMLVMILVVLRLQTLVIVLLVNGYGSGGPRAQHDGHKHLWTDERTVIISRQLIVKIR